MLIKAIENACLTIIYMLNSSDLKTRNTELYYYIKDRICEIRKKINEAT